MLQRLSVIFILIHLGACSTPPPKSPDLQLRLPAEVSRLIPDTHSDWMDSFRHLAGKDIDTPQIRAEGIKQAIELLDLTSAFLEQQDLDPSAKDFIKTLNADLMDLELEEIYQILQPSPTGRGREVLFIGRRKGPKYRLSLATPGVRPSLAPNDFTTRVRLTPMVRGALGEAAYELEGEMILDTDQINGRQVLNCLVDMLRRLESTTRPRPGEIEGTLPAPLGREDWRLLKSLARSFPQTHSWLTRFMKIENLVDFKTASSKGASPILQVHPRIELLSQPFENQYPRIYKFLNQTSFDFDMTTRYLDYRDREIMKQKFVLSKKQMTGSFFLSEGRFLPVTQTGHLVSEESLSPIANRNQILIEYDTFGSYRGLQVRMERLPVDLSWQVDPAGFTVDVRMRTLPIQAEVQGNLFGFVPPWVLALDFDEIFKKSILAMTQGRKGRGTRIRFTWQKVGDRNQLIVKLQTEIPARGLVRMLYRFWKKRFLPRIAPPGDRSRFKNDLYQKLRDDLQKIDAEGA
ncbi:MAG: hypothetical protein QF752_09895 [Planctomycetota bacterium]|nr:hypothetical protein [Planctomycetota bacterium]